MIIGEVVFPGVASANLERFRPMLQLNKSAIIYSEELTTEVAFFILNNPVIGIITEHSSFATHGANILRCMMHNSLRKIVWVSGIKEEQLQLHRMTNIFSNGIISKAEDDMLHISPKLYSFHVQEKHSIIEYDLIDNTFHICYWSHRRFNRLTFSIWKAGLVKNLLSFGIKNPSIELRPDGHIWFFNAPLIKDYVDIAINFEYGIPHLQKQIALYDLIYKKLASKTYSAKELVEMATDFFSVFLLFHDTYEDVLYQANDLFLNITNDENAYQLMDCLMRCRVDEWMLKNNILLRKRKNYLSDEKPTPIPPFTIGEDIDDSVNKLMVLAKSFNLETFWNSNKDLLEYYVTCFVVKEWKFVIIKALSTRFSTMLHEQFPDVTFEDFSNMSINKVNDMIQ